MNVKVENLCAMDTKLEAPKKLYKVIDDSKSSSSDDETGSDKSFAPKNALDKTEIEIESLLFGNNNGFIFESNKKILDDYKDERHLKNSLLNENRSEDGAENTSSNEEGMHHPFDTKGGNFIRTPAWVDDEDCNGSVVSISTEKRLRKLRTSTNEEKIPLSEYEHRLRSYHSKTVIEGSIPVWADIERQRDGTPKSVSDLLLASTASILKPKNAEILPPKKLLLSCVKFDYQFPSFKNLHCCFHPKENILVTSTKKNLHFYEVNAISCELLHNSSFGHFGINHTCFSPSGQELYVTGRNRKIYLYNFKSCQLDLINNALDREHKSYKRVYISPNNKFIVLYSSDEIITFLDANTKQWLFNLRINSPIQAICFNVDGSQLWATGDAGEVFIFDIDSRICTKRFRDFGYSLIRSMEISPDGMCFATGQESGILNLYRLDEEFYKTSTPKPVKSFTNLITPISNLMFNHDSQILAYCSRDAKNAVRLIHLSSCTVFENWPSQKTNVGYVKQTLFSYDSSYLLVSNSKGKIHMFRLCHYHPNDKHKKLKNNFN